MGIFTSTASAIRKGLSRTREVLGGSLRGLLQGRALDDEVIDEIESRLMRADVGPRATAEIIGELRAGCRAGRITEGAEALELLKSRLKARLAVRLFDTKAWYPVMHTVDQTFQVAMTFWDEAEGLIHLPADR